MPRLVLAGAGAGPETVMRRWELEVEPTSWKIWIAAAILALLFHMLLLVLQPGWVAPSAPPRVDVQTINPQKLDQIRREWRAKQLLLDKNPNQKSEKEASPDAKYLSDKNIHVDKEQRARNTTVVPKPGTPNAVEHEGQQHKAAPPAAVPAPRNLPKLGDLGLPLKLNQTKPPAPATREHPAEDAASHAGGEQYVHDQNVPEGSENLLNTQESVYYSFYARIYETFGPVWQSQINSSIPQQTIHPADYTTVVDVVLDREGNLLRVQHIQDSGIRPFDLAADVSWKKLKSFPNPPQGLVDANGEIHMQWSLVVHVGGGLGFSYVPPSSFGP